jgi:hypothetical protein
LEESTYVVVGIPGKWGFKSIHGLHKKKMLQCFMPCFLCPTSNGKDLMGKINQLGIGILLLSNELGHS